MRINFRCSKFCVSRFFLGKILVQRFGDAGEQCFVRFILDVVPGERPEKDKKKQVV